MPTPSPAAEIRAAAEMLKPLAEAAQRELETGDYWKPYNPATTWRDGLTNGMGGASGDLAGAIPPAAVIELARWLESAARDAMEIGPDPHALATARAITAAARTAT
jgi:hypothetical protein